MPELLSVLRKPIESQATVAARGPVPILRYCQTTPGVAERTISNRMGLLIKKGPNIVVT